MNSFRFLLLVLLIVAMGAFSGCSGSSEQDVSDDGSDGDTDDYEEPWPDVDNNIDGDKDPDLEIISEDKDQDEVAAVCDRHCINVKEQLDFGAVAVNDSKTIDLIIDSVGSETLKIFGLTLLSGTSSEFSIKDVEQYEDGLDLAPFNPVTIQLTYAPSDQEADIGTLLILTNDDLNEKTEVLLKGGFKGTTSLLLIEPEGTPDGDFHQTGSLDWEEQDYNCANAINKPVIIKAIPDLGESTQPLQILSMELSDGAVEDFLFDPNGQCRTPFEIEPDKEKTCYIRYNPCTKGEISQTLEITATDNVKIQEQSATVDLAATCVAALIAVEPPEVNFGHLLYERGGHGEVLTISNHGDGDLIIDDIDFSSNSNNHFTLSGLGDVVGKTLAPGEDATLVLLYDPEKKSNDSAILRILSSDPQYGQLSVIATGYGVEQCPPGEAPEDETSPVCIPNCTPGEMICMPEGGSTYVICEDDGVTLSEPVECENPHHICVQTPDGAVCQAQPCQPGRKYCDQNGDVITCNSEGTAFGDPINCDTESDPCYPEICVEGAGCMPQKAEDNSACDDGDPCTMGDHCSNGFCVWDDFRVCDDANECTSNDCNIGNPEANPDTGCVFKNVTNGNSCDDGHYCTVEDFCEDGHCLGGGQRNCDDTNVCTDSECNESAKKCDTTIVSGRTCTDNNQCTVNDACDEQGDCIPGEVNPCDDDNSCTWDSCTSGVTGGCQHTFLTGSCDDGDPCTVGDECATVLGEARCISGDSKDCDDNNFCTGPDTCDEISGDCLNDIEVGKTCSDSNLCTEGDSCQDVGGVGTCVSGDPKECGDGNICKSWYCHPTQGCKFNINNYADCDDFDPCTIGDYCWNGTCSAYGSEKSCDDENECTIEYCDSTKPPGQECVSSNVSNQQPCDDGNICTEGDHCQEGVCESGTQLEDCCNDGNSCTEDSFDVGLNKCVFDPIPMAGVVCNDGDPCTLGDVCNGTGQCSPGAVENTCEDDNSCTDDYCLANIGCRHTDLSDIVCNDGDPCFVQDMCDEGVCKPGTEIDCADTNDCTNDYCLPFEGCQHDPLNSGTCNDGDPCTVGDACSAGACQPGGGTLDCANTNDCTSDSCVAGEGCVNAKLTGTDCSDDNLCTLGDICQNGVCQPGSGDDCDDDNLCTNDSCNPSTGCTNTPNSTYCNDDDPCTTIDICQDVAGEGVCVGTTPRNCNDYNVCTTDYCDFDNPDAETNGCVYDYNEDACADDGNICTDDVCIQGQCQHVNNSDPCSDDDNPCTDDYCQNASCQHVPNSDPCEDSDPCTVSDTCQGGTCLGSDKDCSAYDSDCKYGACNSSNGFCYAANRANGYDCNDGLWCTVNDYCNNGSCTGDGHCPDGNCRSDECLEDTQECALAPEGTECNDGNSSNFNDVCDAAGNCSGTNEWTEPGVCGHGWDNMVAVPGTTWCMDKYEAVVSRSTNCSSTFAGQSSDDYWWCWLNDGSGCIDPKPRACSLPNVKPSRWITFDQAKKACERVNKELCRPELWARACSNDFATDYPYGSSYGSSTCNGAEYGDANGGRYVRNTGSISSCQGYFQILDMSGNSKEWTDTHNYNDTEQPVYGGGAWDSSGNLRCDSWSDRTWNDKGDDVGFRCCVNLAGKRSVDEEEYEEYEESAE